MKNWLARQGRNIVKKMQKQNMAACFRKTGLVKNVFKLLVFRHKYDVLIGQFANVQFARH